jgi:hypothetical protein
VTVYVLIPRAIYNHGVVGVYESEQDARDAALEIWPTTDGHHEFVIVPRVLGETHPDVFTRILSWGIETKPDPGEPRIEVWP